MSAGVREGKDEGCEIVWITKERRMQDVVVEDRNVQLGVME